MLVVSDAYGSMAIVRSARTDVTDRLNAAVTS